MTISGPEGTLIIAPMSLTTAVLQRFQIASWRGGSQLGLMRARALLHDVQFNLRAMNDLKRLFAAVHETAPPEPFDMVQLLTYELYMGGKFHAFYIPPAEFGHFAVAKAPDLSGLLADPPGPPAGWPIQARIAAMLRRVPGQVVPELKAQVAALLDPKSIALLAIFLSALAVAQAYGVGEIVDAILVGLAWWVARWAGLLAVKDIVTSIIEAGTAQSLPAIDEAADRFARALLVLGLVFLSKLISRAGDEENVSEPPKPKANTLPSSVKSKPASPDKPPTSSSPFLPKQIGQTEAGAIPRTPLIAEQMEQAKNRGEMTADGYPVLPANVAKNFGDTPQPWNGDDFNGQIYRVIDADSLPNGAYWAPGSPPSTEAQWRAAAAVQNDWNGDGGYVTANSSGLRESIGPAAPQDSSDAINVLPGGGTQIWIPANSANPTAPLPTPWNTGR